MLPNKTSANPRRRRVLMADDNTTMLDMFRIVLRPSCERLNIDLIFAVDGGEALCHLRDAQEAGERFDLVVLDYQMPVMNGPDIAKTLRSWGDHETTIVLLTAYIEGIEEEADIESAEFAMVLSKQDMISDLRSCVECLLETQSRRGCMAPCTKGACPHNTIRAMRVGKGGRDA